MECHKEFLQAGEQFSKWMNTSLATPCYTPTQSRFVSQEFTVVTSTLELGWALLKGGLFCYHVKHTVAQAQLVHTYCLLQRNSSHIQGILSHYPGSGIVDMEILINPSSVVFFEHTYSSRSNIT